MVIISESDGATLDFKRCSSGDLGMPLSAQRLPLDRNRNGNALMAFKMEVKRCPMLASEPEGDRVPVESLEVCDRK